MIRAINMKRTCPNCNTKNLKINLWVTYKPMSCKECDGVYEYSGWLRLINLLLIFFVISLDIAFNFEGYDFILVIILFGLVIYSTLHFFPVIPVGPIEYSRLPPTLVHFEQTDDVSENIRRYKEAQRKAVVKKIKGAKS